MKLIKKPEESSQGEHPKFCPQTLYKNDCVRMYRDRMGIIFKNALNQVRSGPQVEKGKDGSFRSATPKINYRQMLGFEPPEEEVEEPQAP